MRKLYKQFGIDGPASISPGSNPSKVCKPKASPTKSSPTKSSPTKSSPTKPKRATKANGKKNSHRDVSTPATSPNESGDDVVDSQDTTMTPQRWSSRTGAKKNYAEIEKSDLGDEEDDGTEEIVSERAEVKTEEDEEGL